MNRFKLGAIGTIIWILGILIKFSSVYVILQTNVYALVLAISYVVYGLGVILISLAVLEFRKVYKSKLAFITSIFSSLSVLFSFVTSVGVVTEAPYTFLISVVLMVVYLGFMVLLAITLITRRKALGKFALITGILTTIIVVTYLFIFIKGLPTIIPLFIIPAILFAITFFRLPSETSKKSKSK